VKATTARYGEDSWAVITGSTDGIGKAAAIYLARQGFNIVLVSRTLAKLQTVAKEVEAEATKAGKKIKTKVISNDWTKNFDAETHTSMYQQHLKDLDISILINNVGMADAGDFTDLSEQQIHNMITCNVYSTALMTNQIIHSFKRRFEKNNKIRSLLINTSAMAAIVPCPFVSVYSATKIFGDFLLNGLSIELAQYNVDCSAWRAAGVQTKIIGSDGDIPPKEFGMATPEEYVTAGLSKCASGVHSGYYFHEFMHLVWTNINDIAPVELCMGFFNNMLRGMMAKEMAKKKKA